MPTYAYRCPNGHPDFEVKRHAEFRDTKTLCPACEAQASRLITQPMAVLWAGKFHDPWAQKVDRDGLGSEW